MAKSKNQLVQFLKHLPVFPDLMRLHWAGCPREDPHLFVVRPVLEKHFFP